MVIDQLIAPACSNAYSERMTTHSGYQFIDRPSNKFHKQQGVGRFYSLIITNNLKTRIYEEKLQER